MADIPDELNRKVLKELQNKGMEITLEELIATRKVTYQKIREEMRKRGHSVPDGDLELLDWMHSIGFKGV